MKLTVICENSVERVAPVGLLGEHGFACLLQLGESSFLFDTGAGGTLINNCKRLGVSLETLDGVIISHGHRDHSGGLMDLLAHRNPLPIYAHPELFRPRYSTNQGSLREIGCPWTREQLEAAGARFELHSTPHLLTKNLILSGAVPRRKGVEAGDPNLQTRDAQNNLIPDPLDDDLSLYLSTDQGLVIILGCAHAGLCTIIDHARQVTCVEKIRLLLGGTHLKFFSPDQLQQTLTYLKSLDIEQIGACHCTGMHAARLLADCFGERYFNATVGSEISL